MESFVSLLAKAVLLIDNRDLIGRCEQLCITAESAGVAIGGSAPERAFLPQATHRLSRAHQSALTLITLRHVALESRAPQSAAAAMSDRRCPTTYV
jgi:hypothetical protein